MTDKQKIFCEKYIQCWNATEASRQAGYSGNYETLRAIGSENLTKPNIKDYIDERINEVSMSTNEVLHRLTEWGRGTVEPFLTDDDFSEALSVNSEEARNNLGLIKKIKQYETSKKEGKDETVISRRFEIELHDAKDAVDKIARIRGMYNDKLDITSKGDKIVGSPIIAHNPKGEEPNEL